MTSKTKRNIVVIAWATSAFRRRLSWPTYLAIRSSASSAGHPLGLEDRLDQRRKNPFEGDEPGMDELMARVVLDKKRST